MNSLDHRERRLVPPWCHITADGTLITPYHNEIWIPRDAARSLDIFWDGCWCRVRYYTWDYGQVFGYQGPRLPQCKTDWTEYRYTPTIELEVRVLNLAGQGMLFEQLAATVRRPRVEIAAIMDYHGYNGHACTIHQGLKTQLLWFPQECA